MFSYNLKILNFLFGPPSAGGIGISILRLPVGLLSDFMVNSPKNYAEKRDLSDFSVEKDLEFFVPLLLEAAAVQPGRLR